MNKEINHMVDNEDYKAINNLQSSVMKITAKPMYFSFVAL